MRFRKVLLLYFLFIGYLQAQVKVGDNPTTINPNSILELESLNQGLLMPRVELINELSPSPLTSHVQGMTVYNITSNASIKSGFYFNNGTKWVKLANNFTTINGLHVSPNNDLMLGGKLMEPTTIETDSSNTFALTGLKQGSLQDDEVLLIDPNTGVIKKTPYSSLIQEKEIVHISVNGQTEFQTPLPINNIDKVNLYRNGVRIGVLLVDVQTIALEAGVVCQSGDEIRIVQIY